VHIRRELQPRDFFTCHATFGCRRSRMYCVSGDGSSSYLSNGRFSATTGSHGMQENFTTGWADLGGYTHNQVHTDQVNRYINVTGGRLKLMYESLMTQLDSGPIHTYTSTSTSTSPCSFVRVAIDSNSCKSYKWSVHVDLHESELTRKLVVIFIIKIIIF